jgi:hypothetical protein
MDGVVRLDTQKNRSNFTKLKKNINSANIFGHTGVVDPEFPARNVGKTNIF